MDFAALKDALRSRDSAGGRWALPSNGEPVLRMMSVREIREDAREVDFVCSTEALDSWGTILEQDWDLKRYKANPVVLFAHKSRDLPIGQGRNVRVEGTGSERQLVATVWFSDKHQTAREVWELVREKTLRGISVGFDFKSYRFEMEKDVEYLILSDLELIELSVTPCPANPDCLSQLRARASAPLTRGADVAPAPSPTPPKPAQRSAEKTTMDEKQIEELQKRTAELTLKNAEIEARAKALTEERESLTKSVATLTSERDAATSKLELETKRADEAETIINKLEVRALVGKKITPAEEPEFVELRSTNKALYERMLAKKDDMPHEKQVIPDVANQTPPTPAGDTRSSDEAALAKFNASLPKV